MQINQKFSSVSKFTYNYIFSLVNGLGNALIDFVSSGFAYVVENVAHESIKNSRLKGAILDGNMGARKVAATSASKTAARLAVLKGGLSALSKFSGVVGVAATGFSFGARIGFLYDCLQECDPCHCEE